MINLGLVISEKAAGIVIGITPFSKILQDLQVLLNAEAISQKRLLGEKEMNTFEYPILKSQCQILIYCLLGYL